MKPPSQPEIPRNTTNMDVQLPIEAKDIQKLIPHRYPFLQLDRITAFESMKTLTAIKNVTMNKSC